MYQRSNDDKVNGLMTLTIFPALCEDFEYKSREEAEQVLKALKKQVNAITADDIYFEEEH